MVSQTTFRSLLNDLLSIRWLLTHGSFEISTEATKDSCPLVSKRQVPWIINLFRLCFLGFQAILLSCTLIHLWIKNPRYQTAVSHTSLGICYSLHFVCGIKILETKFMLEYDYCTLPRQQLKRDLVIWATVSDISNSRLLTSLENS